MGYAKVKDVIVVSEPHAISVYRRSGTTIHLTMVYADKQSFVERYDHDDDLECFMNWMGLQESLEIQAQEEAV